MIHAANRKAPPFDRVNGKASGKIATATKLTFHQIQHPTEIAGGRKSLSATHTPPDLTFRSTFSAMATAGRGR